ncbi:MAG: hypothetical protein HY646_21230 [Acidobacteria bacterium]|nr:hypothetical protein [Acidobacteriota bacterium]
MATISGTNLSSETYFDVRFHGPGGTTDEMALNWQQGTSAPHSIPADAAVGTWTETGVRAHREATDHTGPFVPIIAGFVVTR